MAGLVPAIQKHRPFGVVRRHRCGWIPGTRPGMTSLFLDSQTTNKDEAAARSLLTPAAVRSRAHELLDIALADGLAEWRVDLAKLGDAADLTAETVRANYP